MTRQRSVPPAIIYRWLRRRLPPGSAGETILGDLHEEYRRFRPAWGRDLWYSVVALRTAVAYAGGGTRDVAACSYRGARLAGDAALDLRHSLRSLVRHPAYSFVAVLTLGLGIGATTVIFSIVNGVLLKPLPYHEPQQLLRVGADFGNGGLSSMSMPNVRDLRTSARSLADMSAYQHWSFNLSAETGTEATAAQRLSGLRVEAGFLELLGVPPQHGRAFVAEDNEGSAAVVVIGDRLWRTHFSGDPNVVGRRIYVDLVPHRVIGILPPQFAYLQDPQIFVPLPANSPRLDSRRARQVDAIARLQSGSTADTAIAELQSLYSELARRYPEANEGMSVAGIPAYEWRVRSAREQLLLFAGAVALVLAISCANVANLSLARAQTRRREISVRAALGAGRGRLVRLLVVENVVVALLAGLLAALIAPPVVGSLLSTFTTAIPRAEEVAVDAGVLLFTIVVAALAGIAVGLVPALVVGRRCEGSFVDGGRTIQSGRWVREGLIVAEVALAVVLVSGASLLLDTVTRLRSVDLGVREEGVLTFSLGLPAARYTDSTEMNRFWDSMAPSLTAIAGIEAVGLSTRAPLSGGSNGTMFLRGRNQEEARVVEARAITPDYLPALGLELRSGRTINAADRDPGGGVLVNEAFVGAMTDDGEVLGEFVAMDWSPDVFPIVGVVSDVRDFGPTSAPRPTVYWHIGAPPFGANAYMTAAIRTEADPMSMLAPVRERLRALDPDIPLVDISTLQQLAASRVGGDRQSALSLLGAFAIMATVLSAVGIYGVMAFVVAERTREVGVRVALGASPSNVRKMVAGDGLRLAAIGIAIGSLLSLASGRLLTGLLYEVAPTNPYALATVAAIMLATAALACWLPAQRAARLSVMSALRID